MQTIVLESVRNTEYNLIERLKSFDIMMENEKLKLVLSFALIVLLISFLVISFIYFAHKKESVKNILKISFVMVIILFTPWSMSVLNEYLPSHYYETIIPDVQEGDRLYRQQNESKALFVQREDKLYKVNGLALTEMNDVQVEIKY